MSVLINKDTKVLVQGFHPVKTVLSTPNKLWLTALKLSAALPQAKAVKPTWICLYSTP